MPVSLSGWSQTPDCRRRIGLGKGPLLKCPCLSPVASCRAHGQSPPKHGQSRQGRFLPDMLQNTMPYLRRFSDNLPCRNGKIFRSLLITPLFGNGDSSFYVGILSALVASCQQYNNQRPAPKEIHPVAGSAIDTHLAQSFAHWLNVAWIAQCQSVKSHLDSSYCALIF